AGLPFGGQSQYGSNAGTAMPSGVGNAGVLEVGPASPWRFFDQQLAGQISWLLPLAALGLLVAGWQERLPLWPRSWRAPAPLTRPVVGLGLLGAAGLVVARLWPRPGAAALARVAAIAGALAVLIAPIAWAAIPVWGGNAEIALPYAGPTQQESDSLPYIGGKV